MSRWTWKEVQRVCWSHVISWVSIEDLVAPVVGGPFIRPLWGWASPAWGSCAVSADPSQVGLYPWQLTRLIATGNQLVLCLSPSGPVVIVSFRFFCFLTKSGSPLYLTQFCLLLCSFNIFRGYFFNVPLQWLHSDTLWVNHEYPLSCCWMFI